MPAIPRVMTLTLLALVLALLSPQAVEAKRERVEPTTCRVEPRSAAYAATAAATPVPDAALVIDTEVESPADLPQGGPAAPEKVGQITAFVQEYAGCVNSGDGSRIAAMMTESSLAYLGGEAALAEHVGPDSAAAREIAWVSISEVRQLKDGCLGAVVAMGVSDGEQARPLRETAFWLFEEGGAGWLLAGQISGNVEGYTDGSTAVIAPAASSEQAILRSAKQGFTEVDSALYAEPTMMGAQFSIEAMLMVDSEIVGDVACELFAIERGASSATITALCHADPSLAGRAAYLDVKVRGPRQGSGGTFGHCEDAAPLAEMMAFSCTVDLSSIAATP